MACAISNETRDYILKCDRDLPKEKQTVFKLKPLSVKDQAAVADVSFDRNGFRMGSERYETIKRGLVGWSNFFEADGKTLCPFSANMDDNVAKLQDYWLEICLEIKNLSEPDEDELGNSDSLPSGN